MTSKYQSTEICALLIEPGWAWPLQDCRSLRLHNPRSDNTYALSAFARADPYAR